MKSMGYRQSLYMFLFMFSVLFLTPVGWTQSPSQVVSGGDGWLFLEQEIRFLNVGPFWGEHAESASRAARADAKDPTPAIVAFHQALAEKNISLLLVPVPPKALIYSEHVPEAKKGEDWGANLDQYYSILREKGIKVLDLRKEFLNRKHNQNQPLYCREDTHWSGYGITVAADRIAEEIASLRQKGSKSYTGKWRDIQIVGDLRRMLAEDQGKSETVSVREVADEAGRTPEADPSGPMLVLGDSHVLVFHAGGDMFARGAGLSDQLALNTAGPVDVTGVRGSGATPARLSLFRKVRRNKEYWTDKKVVVWCFAAREFTESDGWRVLPIEP